MTSMERRVAGLVVGHARTPCAPVRALAAVQYGYS